MTKKFYNLPRQYSTTTGDSDIELGAAVPGCKTLAQAGFVDSDELNYGIVTYDTATHRPIGTEVGLGKYLASDSDGGPYLQRTTVYSSISQDTDDTEDSHITLTGLSEVYCPWLAEDILRVRESDSDPSAYPVNTIIFPAGTTTDNGSGVVTVDFSADSDVVTLTGTQTLTNKSLSIPIIANGIVTTTFVYSDNVRQTFNPGATAAGINVGATSDDPSIPVNGDLWYNSTDNTLDARINGATVSLGAGGGDVYDSDVIFQDITTGNADSDSHGFLLKLSMDTAHFLRADGSWQAPPAGGTVYDSDIVFSDTTANNADSAEHGFLPKLSADSTDFLNGKGEWATPAGGGGIVDYDIQRYTAGSITLNNTSWTDVSGPADLSISASTGDLIEVGVSFLWGNENVESYLDYATLVSASPVNYISGGTAGATNRGVVGWQSVLGGANIGACGSMLYVVQAGDISGGTVTLRLRYRTSSGADKTLFATSDIPLHLFVKNMGQ
jgi:hypothetical protein